MASDGNYFHRIYWNCESGSTQPSLVNSHSSKNTEEKEENFLEGVLYPLNSKRLAVGQPRRLATMLELPCDGTAATLKQVIAGNLVKLGY